jgi:CheY-like chemotaxis protein
LKFQKTKWDSKIEAEIPEINTEFKNIKVLVVEDIRLNQLLMKTLLDDFGFEREVASNGLIAIEKLKEKPFDIVLMDLQMPEMNGFEATDYIRKVMLSNIPIIALTADVTTMDLAKCKEVGMDDYIAKPVDEKILFNKIVSLVRKPNSEYTKESSLIKSEVEELIKYIDLTSLSHRTKSNPSLMAEMISLYLEQTPPLILAMKKGLEEQDWNSLYSATHKMIPSFSIVGLSIDFENMAKKVQEYASAQQQTADIHTLGLKIEEVCNQACIELEQELKNIKKTSI